MEYCEKCGYIKSQCECEKPKTNADRIRAMSDEELAEFLADDWNCEHCSDKDKQGNCNGATCKVGILAWLQSEVEA